MVNTKEVKNEKQESSEMPNNSDSKANEASTSILSVKNLNMYYGDFQALKNISMEIQPNSITAFIGPSGCGKSTFLRMFNRMNDTIPGTSYDGQIIYDDVNVLDDDIDVIALRKEIGMVFQHPNPFAKSIFKNISYALNFYGIRNRKDVHRLVEKSLKHAALWDEVKERLGTSALSLSGGQQQRLCVARSLALDPNVLLLDEPSSALDPIANAKIEDMLLDLKKDYTIIIVTHNMQQASRVADRTAFFYQGEVIEENKTEVIFTNPKEELTERYVTGKFG